MHTISYKLFSSIDGCPLLRTIYEYGKDLTAIFETIEFNIVETRDHSYVAIISENQRDILLTNMDAVIAIYLRLKVNYRALNNNIHYSGLRRIFNLGDDWEKISCELLFSSIFYVLYNFDAKIKISRNKLLSDEIAIIIKSYLKYLGRECELNDAMQRMVDGEWKPQFNCESDLLLPLATTGVYVPTDLVLPKVVKYEVRKEIDGLFYASISEDSALELFKCGKIFVELAKKNYHAFKHSTVYQCTQPVFFDRFQYERSTIRISDILMKILILVWNILQFAQTPKKIIYVTERHLEEFHILAQHCLEIGFFDLYYENFSKEITDSVQLAQLIDTNIKTLVPTGSRTKPAIRGEVYE